MASLVEAMNEELTKVVHCGLVVRTIDLGEDELDALNEYLSDSTVSSESIKRALKRVSVNISADVIMRHRKTECSCSGSWGRLS